ncbi:RNase H domain-containing protein [Trichonephila clavipes]|nr:RNase H domain-containing protein [Trichonephila clavipes]
MVKTESVDIAVQEVTNVLIAAADLSIPKISSHSFPLYKPWSNADCQTAYKNQRKLWGIYRRYPTTENLLAFKKAKANARRLRRQIQRQSWSRYVSSLTSSTSSKQLWKKVKAGNGMYREFSFPILQTSNCVFSSPVDISNILAVRYFHVRIGHSSSHTFIQDQGVPQGSVLSVNHFNIHMSSKLDHLPPSVRRMLYVDDLQVSCQGSDMRLIERQLQTTVNRLVKCCDQNGHTISPSKSSCVHFCRKRNLHPDPFIHIRNIQIPVVNYGCVVYGSARASVLKRLDTVHHSALRICSGAFRTSPVTAYMCAELTVILVALQHILISNLCQFCVYTDSMSALESLHFLTERRHPTVIEILILLRKLERKGFDIIFPGYLDTWVYLSLTHPILETSAALYSLPFNVANLIGQTFAGVSSSDSYSPAFQAIMNCLEWTPINFRFRQPLTYICDFYMGELKRAFSLAHNTSPDPDGIFYELLRHLNEDLMASVYVDDLQISCKGSNMCMIERQLQTAGNSLVKCKSTVTPVIFQSVFAYHRSQYSGYSAIYTDGSKRAGYVGCGVVIEDIMYGYRLNTCRVLIAEAVVIYRALQLIGSNMFRKYCIYTDSMSVLEALKNSNDWCHSVVCNILDFTSRLYSKEFDIVFFWVPIHVGIIGNEQVDSTAGSATILLPLVVPLSDLNRVILHHIFTTWQESWHQKLGNKLHYVKPVIGT